MTAEDRDFRADRVIHVPSGVRLLELDRQESRAKTAEFQTTRRLNAVSADGRVLVGSDHGSSLYVFRPPPAPRIVKRYVNSSEFEIFRMCFTPDSRFLIESDYQSYWITSLADPALRSRVLAGAAGFSTVAGTSESSLLATLHPNMTLSLWNMEDQSRLSVVRLPWKGGTPVGDYGRSQTAGRFLESSP